jgi:hypothetical protein
VDEGVAAVAAAALFGLGLVIAIMAAIEYCGTPL